MDGQLVIKILEMLKFLLTPIGSSIFSKVPCFNIQTSYSIVKPRLNSARNKQVRYF